MYEYPIEAPAIRNRLVLAEFIMDIGFVTFPRPPDRFSTGIASIRNLQEFTRISAALSYESRKRSKTLSMVQVSIYFQTMYTCTQNKLDPSVSRAQVRPSGPTEVQNHENLQEFTRILVKSRAVDSNMVPTGAESTSIGPTHHQLQFRNICRTITSSGPAVFLPISLTMNLQEFSGPNRNSEKSQNYDFSREIGQVQVLILCSNSLFRKFERNLWSHFLKIRIRSRTVIFTRITRILVNFRISDHIGRE